MLAAIAAWHCAVRLAFGVRCMREQTNSRHPHMGFATGFDAYPTYFELLQAARH